MKFCYNTNSTLPKQSQRSRLNLWDCFGKTPSYNRKNMVYTPVLWYPIYELIVSSGYQSQVHLHCHLMSQQIKQSFC